MKIALLTINAGRGGVVNVVWQLAEGLKKTFGCEVVVGCDEGSELGRLRELGVRHERIEFSRDKRSFFAARRSLARFYRAFQPDIVHSHSRWPSMVSIACARRPDVSTLHAQRMTGHGSVLDRGVLRRLLSGWGRVVTVLDEGAKRHLVESAGLDASRIEVVPNGVDENVYRLPSEAERSAARDRFGLERTERVLLFVGSMVAGKRPRMCVEALAAAVGAGEKARLVIVGEGALRGECEKFAAEIGVSERCVFTGWLPDAREAYFASDVLLLPSEEEGFGLVCVEAMLCGVACVRTRTGGCAAQIHEGVTGWSVEVDDRAGFVGKVVGAMKDAEKCRKVGLAGSEHARAEFTTAKFVERMWRVYQKVR